MASFVKSFIFMSKFLVDLLGNPEVDIVTEEAILRDAEIIKGSVTQLTEQLGTKKVDAVINGWFDMVYGGRVENVEAKFSRRDMEAAFALFRERHPSVFVSLVEGLGLEVA